MAAGVAGGLGEYFAVDPVIFRVLFATTAFFGGAGILAYVIAWIAVPERGTDHAAIDRLVRGGRRSIPAWIVTIAAASVIFGLLFSWWAPWRFFPWMFFPVVIAALILTVALSQRPPQPGPQPMAGTQPMGPQPGPQPMGTQPMGTQRMAGTPGTPPPPDTAATDAWIAESRAATRARRRRSAPVRWITLGVLAVTLVVLGIIDSQTGIAIPTYFWAVHFAVIAGLVVGAVLRRPIWWMALLLIPAAAGTFVFAGTRASLHDGSGDNTYTPQRVSELRSHYSKAFGRTTLDLTALPRLDATRTVEVTQAAGEVRLIVPSTLPLDVHANVHLGAITVDGQTDSSGMGLDTDPVTTASDNPLVIDVRISAGQLDIDRSP